MDNEKLDEKIVAEIRRHGALCKPDFPDCGLAYAIRQIIDEARPEPPRREAERTIKCEWVYEDPKWGYGRAMRVVESGHPRFVVGSRFDYGFMGIANEDGYEVTVAPMPASLTPAKGKE
jgi:hypothetical protein